MSILLFTIGVSFYSVCPIIGALTLTVPKNCTGSFNESESGKLLAPTCVLDLLGDSSNVIIICPQPGIIRVLGDYNVFRINCSASYPLEFSFNGIVPTEAIRIKTWRSLSENFSSFGISSFHVDIRVHSIPALFFEYKHLLEDRNTSDAFNYSRTGEYRFAGYFDKKKYYRFFYIFFEEPSASPGFIRNNDTRLKYLKNETEVFVPCRPTHFPSRVEILQLKDVPNVTVQYNATTGFLIQSIDDALLKNFTCTLSHELAVDSLSFGLADQGGEKPPFGFEESLVTRVEPITYSITPSNGRFLTQTVCRIDSTDGSAQLRAIGVWNYAELKLRKDFVLPAFYNRSYTVEIGKQLDDLNRQLATSLGIKEGAGASFCGDRTGYGAQTFALSIQGTPYDFPFNTDWRTVTRENSSVQLFFDLRHNREGQRIFEHDSITFSCRLLTRVYCPPVVWFTQWSDGEVQKEYVDYELEDEVSYFTTRLSTNITKILCAASLWHKVLWRNISLSVSVSASAAPYFDSMEAVERIINKGELMTKLVCTAFGSPVPEIRWETLGKQSKPLVPTNAVSSDRITSILSLDNPEDGSYFCTARNQVGDVRKSFRVKMQSGNYAAIIGVAVTVFIVTVVGALLYYRFLWNRNQAGLTRYEIADFFNGEKREFGKKDNEEYVHEFAHLCPYDKRFEIDSNRFQIDKTSCLGSGAYGVVLKGLLDGVPIAVKTVNRNAEKSYLKALLSELKIQIHLGNHPNLVRFLGASTKDLSKGSVCIFVELCGLGNLEKYLRKHQESYSNLDGNDGAVTLRDLNVWAIQIACGMEYLSSKKVIHGDLAARNVLLCSNRVAKITDFGLSRQMYAYADYVKKQAEPLPWRWMALESLKHLAFSSKSDVWAYGVTLWELFSLGDVPYAGQTWNLTFVSDLENGLRLPSPKHASREIYHNIILPCWNERPDCRPTFTIIKELLMQKFLDESGESFQDAYEVNGINIKGEANYPTAT